jgi:hypothetical protein
MSNEVKNIYIKRQQERYRELVKRTSKTLMIDEVVAFLDVCRDHAIKVLNNKKNPPKGRSGPKIRYTDDLLPHIKKLFFLMRQPCAKRMKEALPRWIKSYQKHYNCLSVEQIEKLSNISPSTLGRKLNCISKQSGLSATRRPRSSWYKSVVPIKPKDWDVKTPGHFQCDTVAHCGTSLEGAFANTITLTDIHTGWTENFAVFTKSAARVREGLIAMENRLNFSINSIKFDSGSEFMNFGVISYLRDGYYRNQRPEPIDVFRSRPYQKNDNCYVEQKNYTHVRELFGYDRIPERELIQLMNDIYQNYFNPLQNFFMPTMKIVSKYRIGGKIIKKYDQPKTPFQRLIESADTNPEKIKELEKRFLELDPIDLQLGLENQLKVFFNQLRQKSVGQAA